MSTPWRKFNFREWRSDEKLRRCSRDVQAIWLDLCGLIYEAEDYGRLSVAEDGRRRPYTRQELCRITADDPRVMGRAIRELIQFGVCDEERGYLVSRRIAREQQRAELDASNGAKGGNPSLVDKAVAEKTVNPQKPDYQSPDVEEGRVERAPKFDFSSINENNLDELEAGCRTWANGSLVTSAGPLILAPVIKLMAEGCTIDDVRNGIIRGAETLHARGDTVNNLNYFKRPIQRERDDRLKPPENPHERTGQGAGRGGHAQGRGRSGPGNQHRSGSLAAGNALIESLAEAPADLPDRPEDWRTERVA